MVNEKVCLIVTSEWNEAFLMECDSISRRIYHSMRKKCFLFI